MGRGQGGARAPRKPNHWWAVGDSITPAGRYIIKSWDLRRIYGHATRAGLHTWSAYRPGESEYRTKAPTFLFLYLAADWLEEQAKRK